MKKRIALLFVVALFLVEARADEIILAPGQNRTVHLDEAYSSSKHESKAVAYTSGRGSNNVTIHAKREGNTHIQLFDKNGQLIRDLDVAVIRTATAETTETMAAETAQPAEAPVPAAAPEIPAMAEQPSATAPAFMAPLAAEPAAYVDNTAAMELAPAPVKKTKHKAKKKKHVKAPVAAKKYSSPAPSVETPSTSYDVQRTLRTLFPKETVGLQAVGNGLALTGAVSDAATAAQIVQVTNQMVGGKSVINMMQVKSGQQVMLRVRIGEVQRGAMDHLGLSAQGVVGAVSGLFYSNKMYDVSTRLDYLSQNGLMKVLAEPNLTAISGEKATFLAGGEFPIPVPQKGGDAITVEYKKFGVGIEFTPTVLAQNRIRLAVEPEVSEISGTAVKFNGGKIPGITTRRAKTTVELAPGESFMIAGLISDNVRDVSDEMPVLGDIPVLGALFRSTAFKRNETELVIAVTPYLVDPVPSQDIKLPTDKFQPASIIEQSFFGALAHKPNLLGDNQEKSAPAGTHGFMTE